MTLAKKCEQTSVELLEHLNEVFNPALENQPLLTNLSEAHNSAQGFGSCIFNTLSRGRTLQRVMGWTHLNSTHGNLYHYLPLHTLPVLVMAKPSKKTEVDIVHSFANLTQHD
jgi:hypothetical protein